MSKQITAQERLEEFTRWSQSEEAKVFTKWWREHRYSGYAVNNFGRERFGIAPYQAWNIWKYKAEFYAENQYQFPWPEYLDKPNFEDIEKWATEQRLTMDRTAALEKRLGREFWKHMQPDVWYAAFKKIAHELVKEETSFDVMFDDLVRHCTKSMTEKIENAYAYEPGQSEEETELLRRRRE